MRPREALPFPSAAEGKWSAAARLPRKAAVAVLCPRDGGGRDAASLGEGREMERGHARPLQPPWMTEWKWAAAAEGDVVAVLCPREPSSLTVARCFHSCRTIVGQARRRQRGGW